MPASKISAPVGSTSKVSGNNIAMVAPGPMPGNTPISVPIRQPSAHNSRLVTEVAVRNPSSRLSISALISVPDQPGRDRNRQLQEHLEEHYTKRGERGGKQRSLPPAPLGGRDHRGQHHQRPCDDQPQRANGEREQ